jgi:hypothetical protein
VPTDFSLARDGLIFSSTNSGDTWIEAMAPDTQWGGIATSADGGKLFGAAHPVPMGLLDGNQIGGIYTLQTVPCPMLSAAPSGRSLALSWIIPSTRFTLEQNLGSNLKSWAILQTPPTLNLTNLQMEVTVSPTNAFGFYRLKSP